jgi:arylmalonate decarboxylase
MTENHTSPPPNGPLLGLIVPPAAGEVPSDGPALYPHGVRFVAAGLGLPAVSPAGYDQVIDSVVDQAKVLAAAGADAISLMGTSLSFYRGAEMNRRLQEAMHAATGLPATTMSDAIVRALHAVGARRVAVATAYIDDVNERLAKFLLAEGFVPTAIRGLSITDVQAVGEVSSEALFDLGVAVYEEDTTAQALLISCGGLLTLDVIEPLEARLGVPVVSSSLAGFWDVVRQAGADPSSARGGRLFQHKPG